MPLRQSMRLAGTLRDSSAADAGYRTGQLRRSSGNPRPIDAQVAPPSLEPKRVAQYRCLESSPSYDRA
jgi:hypothetical protein